MTSFRFARRLARSACAPLLLVAATSALSGCGAGGASGIFDLFGSPFRTTTTGGTGSGGPTGTTSGSGGGLSGGDRTSIDPCDETQSRKFVRLSLRSLVTDDNVHYFLALVAFVNGTTYPDGAVCSTDVALYTSFGYEEIAEGATRSFGNICIEGPALLYYHRSGEFRSASGQLASGIGPSRGTGATFDAFFNSAGAAVPVPNLILFHNPGTGAGFQLKIAPTPTDACNTVIGGVSNCGQDGWYYVDDEDLPSGSTALGAGSFRRVPNEIQGTGCSCGLSADPWAILAPSNTSATNARCNEFLRGGTVSFAFIRDDQTPPIPQLVWRVTDAVGGVVHDFDQRANIP